MDELVDDHVTCAEHDRAFHDVITRTSGVVRALESHRRVHERVAAVSRWSWSG
ncbi:hypothetical protein [Streptomyces sp. SBT349]|uniref:hypothetical protein n=1 Tax=Streptomyces sp. SBT349 TaxID=1580539 RepID=UPI000AA69AF2|nr:hypothetical protein [Streptomyces sp. SBT349]